MENKATEKDSFPVKLTFRQKAFLSKLLDVYREMQAPLHYSVIAERLGLSSSTAYDMLRLLEQKGMVISEYVTPKVTSGPGRSSIHFSPTAKTIDLFSLLAGERHEQEGWDDVKAHILASLSQGKASEYEDILRELLARMPEARSPLVHCAEVITALLLSLRGTKHTFGRRTPARIILDARVGKLGMSILGGLALGLCLADRRVQQRLGNYQEYTEKYEASLQELSRDSLVKLHQFTREVWDILKAPSR
ncbi:MAG: helix-turn-helix domain-containing protein [Dehalococcoidia bacterium]|nr:helix-turn-helix domain-containing protein [Dehalococcoidia bacterium]